MNKTTFIIDVVGISFFIAGLMIGILVTSIPTFEEEQWFVYPLIRIFWQVGGAIWCGFAIARLHEYTFGLTKPMLVCILIACVVSLNPILDVIQGPIIVDNAQITQISSKKFTNYSIKMMQRGKGIKGTLIFSNPSGTVFEIHPRGRQANMLERYASECTHSNARIAVLLHLDVPLSVHCFKEK